MVFGLEDIDYNYGTRKADIENNIIFDKTVPSTNEAKMYMDMSEADMRRKNAKSTIVYMTPKEYFTYCADMFHAPFSKLYAERKRDTKTLDRLFKVITEKHETFPIPYINYITSGQEGLHRMLVAGELCGWDTKFPVQVIDYYSISEKVRREIMYIYNDFCECIDDSEKYSYVYNSEEYGSIKQQFTEQVDYELEQKINTDYNDYSVSYTLEETNNSYIFHISYHNVEDFEFVYTRDLKDYLSYEVSKSDLIYMFKGKKYSYSELEKNGILGSNESGDEDFDTDEYMDELSDEELELLDSSDEKIYDYFFKKGN